MSKDVTRCTILARVHRKPFNKPSTIGIQWQIVMTKEGSVNSCLDYGVDFDVYLQMQKTRKTQEHKHTWYLIFAMLLIQLNWTRISILKLNLDNSVDVALITTHCGLIFHVKFELIVVAIFATIFPFLFFLELACRWWCCVGHKRNKNLQIKKSDWKMDVHLTWPIEQR